MDDTSEGNNEDVTVLSWHEMDENDFTDDDGGDDDRKAEDGTSRACKQLPECPFSCGCTMVRAEDNGVGRGRHGCLHIDPSLSYIPPSTRTARRLAHHSPGLGALAVFDAIHVLAVITNCGDAICEWIIVSSPGSPP